MVGISRRAWGTLRPPTVAAVGGSYTGPGDLTGLTTGALGFWGLRAFSDATTGDPAVNLTRSGGTGGGGADTQDIATLSDGSLNTASTFFSGSGYTYLVNKLYDQASGPFGAQQNTGSARPLFVLSGLNGLPMVSFSATTNLFPVDPGDQSQTAPFMFSAVACRPSGTAGNQILADANLAQIKFFPAVADRISASISAGINDSTATDAVFHAIAANFNGATSRLRVDSENTDGDTGGSSPDLFYYVRINVTSPNVMDGVEWGVWLGDKQSSLAALTANQTTYWGPF